MSDADFQLLGLRDPRLAIHAVSGTPAWLWAADGARILWSNPVAARTFGAANPSDLAHRMIGPADPHRRQVTQLAARLPDDGTVRLERLRGFGASLGRLMTCACSRLTLSDGTPAVLVAATESPGRTPGMEERISSLLESLPMPAIALTADGALCATNKAAKGLVSDLIAVSSQATNARNAALQDGTATINLGFGETTFHRVGTGPDIFLVATIQNSIADPAPSAVPPSVEPLAPDTEFVQTPAAAPAFVCAENTDALAASGQKGDPTPQHEAAGDPLAAQSAPPDEVTPVFSEPVPSDIFKSVVDNAASRANEQLSREVAIAPPATQDAGLADAAPSQIATDVKTPKSDVPSAAAASAISAALAQFDGPALSARRHPLRFMWQMDQDTRFSLGSDEFSRLIGMRTASAFGRLWHEIAETLGLDPEGKVSAAIASRDTWSGIVVGWPADGCGSRLPVELSGLPIYDRNRNFAGYRGFGVCRDLEGLARLAAQRRDEVLYSTVAPVVKRDTTPDPGDAELAMQDPSPVEPAAPEIAKPVPEKAPNVVPFRAASETKTPALTAGESSAFDELARRLSATLDGSSGIVEPTGDKPQTTETTSPHNEPSVRAHPPAFLQPATAPLRVASAQDSQLLDRLPIGILVYRLDRLIYANKAFLDHTGFESLHALTDAGGLDALFVEPIAESGSSTSETGTPVVIAATHSHQTSGDMNETPARIEARLFAISWDSEPALALMFSGPRATAAPAAVALPSVAPAQTDLTHAEELSTILDTTAEGIVMFDGLGRIVSCNRSAEALFGRDGNDIARLNLIDLFAPESQRTVLDYLESVKGSSVASLLDHGRDMLGRVRDGGTIPLSMTMGRTRPDSSRFFAVFRDMSQAKKTESELLQARRQAERATTAKSEILGKISHEVRAPLNAIIGFADVMIEERFGPLGNERYVDYMKDIRASGQRVMSIVDDLLDLSRIESGKLELSFANQDLNNLVEQCVAVMQPQANRERIIIRTSLAHALPSVKADARALRQIAMNLIGSSIHMANAGGQVIVSTTTTDFGDIVLRVRDTGPGLNDNEIAAAMAPFRTPAANDSIPPDNSGVSLSLTKALVEANRAKFNIKTAPHSGTLIEVVFSHASAIA